MPPRHLIIAGFGLSGRSTVNVALERGISVCVIERNASTVTRCAKAGLQIIEGDAANPEILKQAGIDRATDVAVTIPDEEVSLQVVDQVRKLNSTAHIIARCTFVSGGMEAIRRGANEVVVAEQVVANEFSRVMREIIIT